MWNGLIKTYHYKPFKQLSLAFSAKWNQPELFVCFALFYFLSPSGLVCPPSEINKIPWV